MVDIPVRVHEYALVTKRAKRENGKQGISAEIVIGESHDIRCEAYFRECQLTWPIEQV